jgi:hypothetical protein
MKISILPLALLLGVASCGNGSSKKQTPQDTGRKAPKNQKVSASAPSDSAYTHFSHFIAGSEGGKGYKAAAQADWKAYSEQNAAKWKELQTKIGAPIEQWVKSAALEKNPEPGTLFYPFAGGDYYYAHMFFPKQDTVIMIGLEPGGSIFNPDTLGAGKRTAYYESLQKSMFFPHWLGFFRTKSMAVDFNRGVLNGTLHTVLFYLARFDAKIHYIEHFDLDKTGKEINKLNGREMRRGTTRTAYRVGYSLPGSDKVKEVMYFSYDASNQNLAAKPHLLNWLKSRGKVVTFFKAASYLMHYDMFSTMREFVNKYTVRLLQDDSGLPYKFMQNNGFEVKLLGQYTRTIALFANEFQPELKKAYAAAKPAVLPFMIGYNAEFRECNLQSAVKK